jgi:hypothetical protein
MNELSQLRLLHPGWRDLLEILIVAYALYRVMRLFHGTRTLQIVTGLGMLLAIYAASWLLKLEMITYVLGFVFQYGAIALLVVFAPELRAALAHLGQARFAGLFRQMEQREVAEEICDAVERLSRSGIGAIVAIEREVPLDNYAESGSPMEAKVSADPADDDLHTVLAPARWRSAGAGRHDRSGRVHPATVAEVDSRPRARHAPPRGARPVGRDGRTRGRGERGTIDDLDRRAWSIVGGSDAGGSPRPAGRPRAAARRHARGGSTGLTARTAAWVAARRCSSFTRRRLHPV